MNECASKHRHFIPFGHYIFHIHYFSLSRKAPPSDYWHSNRLILYLSPCICLVCQHNVSFQKELASVKRGSLPFVLKGHSAAGVLLS